MSSDRRKYFFDLNNFDSNAPKEEDPDLPPPPPVFSLEEMGAAENEGYARGHADGLEEARRSREHYIASQVAALNEQILSLFLAEQMREKRFEEEVVRVAAALFSKVFPSLSAKHSIDEIARVATSVIARQDKTEIRIEVPGRDLDEIRARLTPVIDSGSGRLQLVGRDDLGQGSCRLVWENGGAMRDQSALVGALAREIEELLAPKSQTGQNDESDDPTKGEDQ